MLYKLEFQCSSVLVSMYKYMKRAHKHKYVQIVLVLLHPYQGSVDICALMVSQIARGCHYHNACTTSCNGGQNALTDLDRKFYHCIALVLQF